MSGYALFFDDCHIIFECRFNITFEFPPFGFVYDLKTIHYLINN